MNAINNNIIVDAISDELMVMGFKGFLLRNLLKFIVDEESLYSFYNFILKTEEEEGEITKVLLVHKFIKHIQDNQSFINYNEYMAAYNSAHTSFEKKEVIHRLFRSDSNDLAQIVLWLNGHMISHIKLYEVAIQYRTQYSIQESLFLIESLHI